MEGTRVSNETAEGERGERGRELLLSTSQTSHIYPCVGDSWCSCRKCDEGEDSCCGRHSSMLAPSFSLCCCCFWWWSAPGGSKGNATKFEPTLCTGGAVVAGVTAAAVSCPTGKVAATWACRLRRSTSPSLHPAFPRLREGLTMSLDVDCFVFSLLCPQTLACEKWRHEMRGDFFFVG